MTLDSPLRSSTLSDHNGNGELREVVVTILRETERLVLRKLEARDWPAYLEYAQSERTEPEGGPFTLGQAWRAFAVLAGHWSLRGYGLLAFHPRDGRDRAIGIAGPFFPPDWPEPEIGWQIWDKTFEGNGFAYEAAVEARAWCAETLGWLQPVSYIRENNARSIKLAKRLGCVLDDTAKRRPDGAPVWRHPDPSVT